MNYLAHFALSIAAAIALAFFLQLPITPALVAIAVLGGIAADVDNSESKAFKLFAATAFLGITVIANEFFSKNGKFAEYAIPLSILAGLAGIGLLILLKPRHRGITHSIFAALVFAAIVFFLLSDAKLALIAFACYATHLIADFQLKFF